MIPLRHKKLLCMAITICAIPVSAQNRKPGLWDLTTTTTHQQPAGAPTTQTTNVCLSQAESDKYNAVVPQIPGCLVNNVVKSSTGMTGALTCSGHMTGTPQSSHPQATAFTPPAAFTSPEPFRPASAPMLFEWTTHTTAVFKGADCGSVKPAPVPPR